MKLKKILALLLTSTVLLTGCSSSSNTDTTMKELENKVSDFVDSTLNETKDKVGEITEKTVDEIPVPYNRKDYKHWLPAFTNNPNWTVREEVLRQQAEEIVIVDKNGKVTKDLYKADKIKSGKWTDPYSGKTFTNPKDMDIDHIVPLSYAHKHGAYKWDKDLKSKFANDYENLLAVSAKENRKKGDKGLNEYMPPLKSYHNEYTQKFNYVINKYGLN